MNAQTTEGRFLDMSTLDTLTDANVKYVQRVAGELDSSFWERAIEHYGRPDEERKPFVTNVNDLIARLTQGPEAVVYRHVQPYSQRGDIGMAVMAESPGRALCFNYCESVPGIRRGPRMSLKIGSAEQRILFDAGIPMRLCDLLTYAPDSRGDLVNVNSGKRLGDFGVSSHPKESYKDRYIALKLPEKDDKGNLILVEGI